MSKRPPVSVAVGLITAGMLVLALLVIWIRIWVESVHTGFAGDRLYVIKATPAVEPLKASDFIELDQVAPKLIPMHIRIYADGHIERDTVSKKFGNTTGCPLKAADRVIQVAPADARRVMEEARQKGFLALPNEYKASSVVYDAGTSVIGLSVGGQLKTVTERGGDPPPLFEQLIDSILQLSPMDEFVYPWRLSPERKAYCEEFRRNPHASSAKLPTGGGVL